MNDNVKCEIPVDLLRFTRKALDDLVIRQKMQAEKPGMRDDAAADLLKEAAEVQKAADFYEELYLQWMRDPDSCGDWRPDLSPAAKGEMSVFEQLKKDALYAQRSFSKELLYQAHGAAQMARSLEAITLDEFMELNRMTVSFMNTDREYIQRQDAEYRRIAQAFMCRRNEGGYE